MPRFLVVLAGGLLVLPACQPRVDVAAAARDLMKTDQAWATLAAGNAAVDSIVAYWASDARLVIPGQPVMVGTAALRQLVAGMQAIPGFHISWRADSAVVSPGGDFGYTYGTNQITAPDATGKLRTTVGRYITVWRKEPHGAWRCTFDISNEGPSSAAAAPGTN